MPLNFNDDDDDDDDDIRPSLCQSRTDVISSESGYIDTASRKAWLSLGLSIAVASCTSVTPVDTALSNQMK